MTPPLLTLGEAADLAVGYAFKSADFTSDASAVRLLRGENVGHGRLRWEAERRWPSELMEGLSGYELRKGDVILAMDRPWVGGGLKYAVVSSEDLPCLLVQRVARLRAREGLDQRFLGFLIGSRAFTEHVLAVQTGTTIPHISGNQISSFVIDNLPPLPEQRAIAEVLGALDDKIESNRRVVQNVMKLSTTLFNKWRSTVSDWNITTFGEFASVYGGATPKTGSPEYWDGPHCWLTPTDVTHLDSIYLSSSARTITDEGLASASTEVHPPGTILMTSRATIGAFAVNQVPCAPNQGFIAVRPANAGQRWFLFHEMSRRVPEMLDRANGTTFREISRGSFKSMELLVPDDDNAFGRLDSELSPLHERAAQAVSETSCLAATRDTLLPALLSGRIRIPVAAELMEAS